MSCIHYNTVKIFSDYIIAMFGRWYQSAGSDVLRPTGAERVKSLLKGPTAVAWQTEA